MSPLQSPKLLPPASAEQAANVVSQARFVDRTGTLDALGTAWEQIDALGLDTEFVRERTFHARPGLIQASDGATVWLLDAVHCPTMPPLAEILTDHSVTKVLHSVGEDLDVLHAVSGAWPQPLFDTQMAAAFLGMPLQVRYEHLVEEIFGVHLPGGKARNDWCRRPLAPALLEYAAQDVVWLPRLYQTLAGRLDQEGRLDWLEEDCQRLVDSARRGDAVPPLSRIKGAGRLEDPVLARLTVLANWRETQAQERDLPRRFVLADETLIEMAQAAADDDARAAVGSLPERQRRRYEASLLDVLERCDGDGFERPDWINPLTPEQRQDLRALQLQVRQVAEELRLEPALIASKRELTRLIRGEAPDWLDGWRGQVLSGRLETASGSIPNP